MKSRQIQTGVTMIELLIVLSIAAILAAMAAPSFNDFIANTRLTSTMSQLTGDLNRARSEAIKRNQRVLVCIRNSTGTDCGTGTNWQSGWLVCYDPDKDGLCDTTSASNPNPIVVHQALPSALTLTGGSNLVGFNADGTGTASSLNMTYGTRSRTANIVATGNIAVSNP